MKKRFCSPSVKQKLIASALFFLFSLLLLWLMLGYPMPTPGLAHRKAEAEQARPHLPIVAQGVVRFTEPTIQEKYGGDRWTVGQRGNEFFLTVARPVAGFLWEAFPAIYLPLTEEHPLRFYPVGFKFLGISEGEESVTIVVTANPDLARVELTQYALPAEERDNEAAFRAAHGVTTVCAETAPGSGVWVGQQFIPRIRSSRGAWSHCTQVRAYAADGTLLYTTPDLS